MTTCRIEPSLQRSRAFAVAKHLVAPEPGQDVVDDRRVHVELGDRAPQIFLAAISEELELRAIRPQDRPVGADPVHAVDGVFEEVAEFLDAGVTHGQRRGTLSVHSHSLRPGVSKHDDFEESAGSNRAVRHV